MSEQLIFHNSIVLQEYNFNISRNYKTEKKIRKKLEKKKGDRNYISKNIYVISVYKNIVLILVEIKKMFLIGKELEKKKGDRNSILVPHTAI